MKEAVLESEGRERERENEKEEEKKKKNCLNFIKAFIAGGISNSKTILLLSASVKPSLFIAPYLFNFF